MKLASTYKMLFLLSLLLKREYSKDEIIEEFEKENISITKTSISNYIKTFTENKIDVKFKTNNKRERLYYFEKEKYTLDFTKKELNSISDIKKLLFTQKDYNNIRKAMRMFYKIACHIENEETMLEFIDFGYYSTINWNLVLQLEKHCNQKDVIIIDYILPQGGNKLITIHADNLKISQTSNRLYLHGILKDDKQLSFLPIDRIYMVKKVVKENVKLHLPTQEMTYTVKYDTYKELNKDEKEKIIKIEKDLVTIQRPIDNDFYIIQKLLYFCPDVYQISDDRIKTLFKDKLEMVKSSYDNSIDK